MTLNLTSTKASSEYKSVLEALLSRTTNPKLGLERIRQLLGASGFDRSSMTIVQVVGTNGKGSTVAFIESILQKNGVATGLFTSPHLCSARERIRMNGAMINEFDFIAAARTILAASKQQKDEASFFECMLAMALWLFQKRNVKVALLEAGLGGRLDATTAAYADLLGVSMIDLDHQHVLGETIQEIATEKLMAAHAGQPVVTVKQCQATLKAMLKVQHTIGFDLTFAEECDRPLGLWGQHQKANAGLALNLVHKLGVTMCPNKTDLGLMHVNWPGRFEFIGDDIVLDGAHNPSGMAALVQCLRQHPKVAGRPLVLVYGSLKSQNAEKKIELLMASGLDIRRIFLHQPQNPRALTISELKTLFLAQQIAETILYPSDIWQSVHEYAKNQHAVIIICGSLYTVGAMRSELMSIPCDPKMPSF